MFLKSSLQVAKRYENNLATETEVAMIARPKRLARHLSAHLSILEDAVGVATLFLLFFVGLNLSGVA